MFCLGVVIDVVCSWTLMFLLLFMLSSCCSLVFVLSSDCFFRYVHNTSQFTMCSACRYRPGIQCKLCLWYQVTPNCPPYQCPMGLLCDIGGLVAGFVFSDLSSCLCLLSHTYPSDSSVYYYEVITLLCSSLTLPARCRLYGEIRIKMHFAWSLLVYVVDCFCMRGWFHLAFCDTVVSLPVTWYAFLRECQEAQTCQSKVQAVLESLKIQLGSSRTELFQR